MKIENRTGLANVIRDMLTKELRGYTDNDDERMVVKAWSQGPEFGLSFFFEVSNLQFFLICNEVIVVKIQVGNTTEPKVDAKPEQFSVDDIDAVIEYIVRKSRERIEYPKR